VSGLRRRLKAASQREVERDAIRQTLVLKPDEIEPCAELLGLQLQDVQEIRRARRIAQKLRRSGYE